MIDQGPDINVMQTGIERSPDPTWLNYWNNFQGQRRLIEEESRDFVIRLRSHVPLEKRHTVLDFGCGSGVVASLLAPHVGRIYLWDAASSVRERARVNVANVPNARLIDLGDKTQSFARVFDLIVVNSVVQYMSLAELGVWMRLWGRMLAPGGAVVLSDLPGPGSRFVPELIEFLRFSLRRGFLLRALWHGARDIAGYRTIRGARPLLRANKTVFESLTAAAGLRPEWLTENLTFRRHRLSLVLRLFPDSEQLATAEG